MSARFGCRTPCPATSALRHDRSALRLRSRHRRRAVQGAGPQPARRLVVRAHAPTSSPTTPSSAPDPNVLDRHRRRAAAGRGDRARSHHRRHSTSLWKRYSDGERTIYGYRFPEGLGKNTALPEPIVTPTTKGADGAHDEPLTCADVVDKGYLERRSVGSGCRTPRSPCSPAVSDVAAAAGLVLADTKYEFGLDRRRGAAPDRRGAHPRLLAVLGGGSLR